MTTQNKTFLVITLIVVSIFVTACGRDYTPKDFETYLKGKYEGSIVVSQASGDTSHYKVATYVLQQNKQLIIITVKLLNSGEELDQCIMNEQFCEIKNNESVVPVLNPPKK